MYKVLYPCFHRWVKVAEKGKSTGKDKQGAHQRGDSHFDLPIFTFETTDQLQCSERISLPVSCPERPHGFCKVGFYQVRQGTLHCSAGGATRLQLTGSCSRRHLRPARERLLLKPTACSSPWLSGCSVTYIIFMVSISHHQIDVI